MAKKKRRRRSFLESVLKSWREYREEQDDELDDDDFLGDEDDDEDDKDDKDDKDVKNNSSDKADTDNDNDEDHDKDDSTSKKDDEDNDENQDIDDDSKDDDDLYGANHKTRCSLDDFDDEEDNWKEGIPVSHVVAGVGVIAIASAVFMGGYSLIKLAKAGIMKGDEDTTEVVEESYEDTTEDVVTDDFTTEIVSTEEVVEEKKAITEYGDMNNLLANANLSEEKKTALEKVWNYVSYYNTTVANQNVEEGNPNKLAISWDEAMAQYLVYNKEIQNPAIVTAILDTYTIPMEDFKRDFDNSIKLDYEAAHIINCETNKAVLFDGEASVIYTKFEDTIAKFNSTSNDDNILRSDIASRFYSDIRSTFNLSGKYSINDPYKMQMLPISNAMLEMIKAKGIDSDVKLNKHEKKQLKKIDDNSDDIISAICSYNVYTITEDEFSYEEIRNFAIQQLTNVGAYNLENRDITTYSKYQDSVVKEEATEEVIEEETTETTVEEQTTSSQKTSDNSKTTESKKKDKKEKKKKNKQEKLDDDDKSDDIPAWMLEENNKNNKEKKQKTKKEESNTTNDNGYIDEDVPEVQPDTPDVSYNNRVINSTTANINNDMMQAYFDAVATAIVENMANSKAVSAEKVKVKSL